MGLKWRNRSATHGGARGRRFLRPVPQVGIGMGRRAASVTVSNQSVTFGALTPSGAVGAKPINSVPAEVSLTGTPTLIAGSAGAYTASISSGRLTFAGAAGAPNASVWRCDLLAGGTVDLTVSSLANTRTVGSEAELAVVAGLSNAVVGSGGKSGLTCIMRYGSYASGDAATWAAKLATLSAVFTLKGERQEALRPTITDRFYVGNGVVDGLTHGNITFEDIKFTISSGTSNFKYVAGLFVSTDKAAIYVRSSNASANIIVRRCDFDHGCPNARTTGLRPQYRFPSIWFEGTTTATVEDCTFANLGNGVNIDGSSVTVRRNIFTGFWDDPVTVNCETGARSNITVKDNIAYNPFADHAVHPDLVHFYGFGGSSQITNLEIAGNLLFPSTDGVLQPPWPTSVDGGAYVVEGALQVGNRTLTTAGDHEKFVIVDARSTPCTLTLGNPTASGADRDVLVQSWFTPSGGLVIANGGFTLYDYDNAQNVSSLTLTAEWETIQLRAINGSNRWEIHRPTKVYQGVQANTVTAGVTGLNIHHNLCWVRSNAINIDVGTHTGAKVEQNSLLPPWPNNGLGKLGYEPAGGSRDIFLNTGSGHTSKGNICSTVDSFAGEDSTGNVKSSERNLNNTWADMTAVLSPPAPGTQQVNPTTIAQAIAYARPTSTMPSGMGALAVSSADDEYVFYDGTNGGSCGLATNTPWFVRRLVVIAAAGGFYATWLIPGYTGLGAVTSYDCEYRINAGAWTGATEVGATATFEGAVVNDVIDVRVRAVNANGNGKWTVAPAITVVTPATVQPTLTQRLRETSTATVSDITTASLTIGATSRVVILVHLRNRSGDTINSATIGASGRAYGAGTALTLVAEASISFFDCRLLVYTASGIAAGNYTIMIDGSANTQGWGVTCYETQASGVNSKDTDIASGTSLSTSFSTTLPKSLILHAGTVDYNTVTSATITDTDLYETVISSILWAGASTEDATTPGTFGATVTIDTAKPIAIASVELLA